jgi:hypothetical protein
MVALVSVECPRPMTCPISCVSTSAVLVAPQQAPSPLFMVTSPSMMRWKVVPFTTIVAPEEQKPPTPRTPAQLVKSCTSL